MPHGNRRSAFMIITHSWQRERMRCLSLLVSALMLSPSCLCQTAPAPVIAPDEALLRSVAALKDRAPSPMQAMLWSMLCPGVGQYYNGDVWKGLAQQALFLGSGAAFIAMVSTSGDFETTNEHAAIAIGGIAGAVWAWSAIDAPLSAGRQVLLLRLNDGSLLAGDDRGTDNEGGVQLFMEDGTQRTVAAGDIATRLRIPAVALEGRSPLLAGLLSTFIPGLGQMYNGQTGKGVLGFAAYGLFALSAVFDQSTAIYALLVLVGAADYFWSVYDAAHSASVLNRDLRTVGLLQAMNGVQPSTPPQVALGPAGRIPGIGISIRW